MSRAVVFDVDGVLVHGFHARPDLRESWDALLASHGMNGDEFRQKFIFDLFLKKVLIGKMSLIEALDRRLPGLGFKGSSMAFAHLWLEHDSQINHELLAQIRRLKATGAVRLFIATNQDHMRAQWLWQKLDMAGIFDDIFYSARAGIPKPHRGFFDFAAARMGNLSEPPLFFDDTPKVIEGARAAGWEAVLFDSNADFTNHPWIAGRL